MAYPDNPDVASSYSFQIYGMPPHSPGERKWSKKLLMFAFLIKMLMMMRKATLIATLSPISSQQGLYFNSF
jgi:hypothetical protein